MSTTRWTYPALTAPVAHSLPSCEFDELQLRSKFASGFERERVVRELGHLGNPAALPILIERANDWVPQVREAVAASLTQLAVPANAAAFVDCLPTFAQLRNRGRAVHAPLIEQIETFVCRPENAAHVLAGINSPRRGVAMACMRLALRYRLDDSAALVCAGIAHVDICIRNMVAPLIAGLDGSSRRTAVAAALANRSMPLRRAALTLLLAENEAGADFTGYLFDRHVSIRKLAAGRAALEGVDVAAVYRTALISGTTPKQRRIALWGVGEFGNRADGTLIEPYLSDAVPAVRRQALNALVRRIGESTRTSLLHALLDEADAVANEAARASVQLRLTFDAAELLALLPTAPRAGMVHRLTSAHQVSNKWERLIFLLVARRSSEEGRRQFADALLSWDAGFNHSFIQPTAAQIAQLRDAMRSQPPASRSWPQGQAMAVLHDTFLLQGIAVEE